MSIDQERFGGECDKGAKSSARVAHIRGDPSALARTLPQVVEASQQTPSDGPVTIVLEARDLDTDERARELATVPRPSGQSEQRRQLVQAASEHHPGAKLRSFANGAATFLDRQHLIVAFYAESVRPVAGRDEPHAAQQSPLFA